MRLGEVTAMPEPCGGQDEGPYRRVRAACCHAVVPVPPSVLTPIAPQRCRELLESGYVGRVVIPIDTLPTALPVIYRVVGDTIAFRTAIGTKLTAALNHTTVGFEVDDFDRDRRAGWSVLVTGVAHVVINPTTIAELDRADVPTWMAAESLCYVQIDIERVSGRRLEPAGQE